MFNFLEIQPGDLVKVLVNIDEVEDELYATVEEHMNDIQRRVYICFRR